jgi:hypothetical protein
LEEALGALAQSPLARAMRGSIWLYPLANVLHVLGAATLFGTLLAAHLCTLGFGRTLSSEQLLDFVLPFAWAGFGLAVLSGPLMFASDPLVFAANPFFRIKLVLLLLAALNALAFHLIRRSGRRGQRTSAAFSVLLWTGVLVMGRSIAYW